VRVRSGDRDSIGPRTEQSNRPGSRHSRLQNGREFQTSLTTLLDFGKQLFTANWTIQEGQGRPLAKGVGGPRLSPISLRRWSSRAISIVFRRPTPCAGCHNVPIPGGAGDIVANVFVLGQRFDSVTMDHSDGIVTRDALDENGKFVTALNFADSRATPGMFGAGYLELLAREITADLRAIESTIQPGRSAVLLSKGIHFGRLARNSDGTWDISGVTGLLPQGP